MKAVNPTTLALAAGLGVAIVAAWYVTKGVKSVGDAVAAGAINPASSNNVVNKGVSAIGAAATGNKDFSLGSWIYEKLNPGAVAAEDTAVHAPVSSGKTASPAPASSDPATFQAGVDGYNYSGLYGLGL